MTAFLALFIGPSSDVVQVDTIEAHDFADALDRAKTRAYVNPRYVAIEIWQHGRLGLRLTLNSGKESFAAKSLESD